MDNIILLTINFVVVGVSSYDIYYMGAGSEILTQIKDYNLKLVEIPITVGYDVGGTLAKNPWGHGFGVLGWLIRVISE